MYIYIKHEQVILSFIILSYALLNQIVSMNIEGHKIGPVKDSSEPTLIG